MVRPGRVVSPDSALLVRPALQALPACQVVKATRATRALLARRASRALKARSVELDLQAPPAQSARLARKA